MKIAYVHGGNLVPSSIFRRPFFEQLKKRGHAVSYFPGFPNRYGSYRILGWRCSQWLKRAVRRIQFAWIRLRRFDVIVLETGILHADDFSLEDRLRRCCPRLIYDVDDAVFLLFPDKIAHIARNSDHVIAGNDELASWLKNHNSSVSVIPTCISGVDYPSKWDQHPDEISPAENERRIIIGWVGSSGNLKFVAPLASVITTLAQEFDVVLRIVAPTSCHGNTSIGPPEHVEWIDINECDVSEEIRGFDIGLMPLPENDKWAKFKCNAKLVQYMMSGVAPVASDVGYSRKLISNGHTGLLVSGPKGFENALRHLILGQHHRRLMGEAARDNIVESHSIESRLSQFESVVLGRTHRENTRV